MKIVPLKYTSTFLAAVLLALLGSLHAAEPSAVASKAPDDQRLTGYVQDTSVTPFIVSFRKQKTGGEWGVKEGGFPDPEPIYMDGVWHL